MKGNATFSLSAIAVAAGGLLVLWLWGSPLIRRVKSLRWIPGPLIAVLLGCVTIVLMTQAAPQQLATLPRITLPAFGSLGDLLGELESPAWSAWRNPSVWVVAVTLALVASLETLLSQEALKSCVRKIRRLRRTAKWSPRASAICSPACWGRCRSPR